MRSEGWHRALDTQMATHKWCLTDVGTVYNYAFFEDVLGKVAREDEMAHVRSAAIYLTKAYQETLWRGDTMFVTSDMLHLLMQAAHDLPADAAFDEHILITDHGFCVFEEPIIGIDRHNKRILFHGIAWTKELMRRGTMDNPSPAEMGLVIFFLVDPADPLDDYNATFIDDLRGNGIPIPPLTLQHFYPANFGSVVQDKYDVTGTKLVTDTLKLFLAMQLIAQQKIGEPVRLRPDRATRRRFQREYGEGDRLITLITLRRKSVKKDDEEPQKVEWSRRWAVQGHWRRQWYPKSKTHDYVYIHSYIKGPEDKPLVLSERRIFNFAR